MQKYIVVFYQAYFWGISRLFPRYAAEKAVNLLFTVKSNPKPLSPLNKPDKTIELKSGAHLFKWEGKHSKSLLIVHGWNGSLVQFEGMFSAFNAYGYTIYGVTPAGYGLSRLPHSHPGLFIDAIVEACAYIPTRVDLAIGHSMGGEL